MSVTVISHNPTHEGLLDMRANIPFASPDGEELCLQLVKPQWSSGGQGFPLVLRHPDSRMNLANFIRAQLYAAFATLRIGFDLLAQENVVIKNLMGHGGVFKTPGVGQRALCQCLSQSSHSFFCVISRRATGITQPPTAFPAVFTRMNTAARPDQAWAMEI